MTPFIVLDVNVLRNVAVVAACITRFEADNRRLAFPEMALFELTKHPERWESTVRRSLELLARCPEAVVLTRASKPLGLAEEATGIPTQTVVDATLTEVFRQVLHDLRGGDGPTLHRVLDRMARYRGQFDHEKYATDSLLTMQTLKKLGQTSFRRDVTACVSADLAKANRASFREILKGALRISEQRDAHVRRGVPNTNADALLAAPSVSYLYSLAVGALALEWIFRGGIDGAAPGRAANDVLDIEYIIAGIWGGALISADQGARVRLADLQEIGATAWPSHADWFRRAKAMTPEEAIALIPGPQRQP